MCCAKPLLRMSQGSWSFSTFVNGAPSYRPLSTTLKHDDENGWQTSPYYRLLRRRSQRSAPYYRLLRRRSQRSGAVSANYVSNYGDVFTISLLWVTRTGWVMLLSIYIAWQPSNKQCLVRLVTLLFLCHRRVRFFTTMMLYDVIVSTKISLVAALELPMHPVIKISPNEDISDSMYESKCTRVLSNLYRLTKTRTVWKISPMTIKCGYSLAHWNGVVRNTQHILHYVSEFRNINISISSHGEIWVSYWCVVPYHKHLLNTVVSVTCMSCSI